MGPVGSGCTTCAKILGTTLSAVFGYEDVVHHKISNVIVDNAVAVGDAWDNTLVGTERVRRLQDIGNDLRQKYQADYLAAKVIQKSLSTVLRKVVTRRQRMMLWYQNRADAPSSLIR